MMTRGDSRPAMNVPNILSIFRFFVTFYFIYAVHQGRLRLALYLFLIQGISDLLDGFIARVTGSKTELGAYLDPIADKVLTGFAFIGLSILGELPVWVVVVVLVREIGITVHRLVVASNHVVAAAWMGKLKTVAQAVALSLALLPLWTVVGEWIHVVNTVTMWVAVILTIASGIDYIVSEVRAARRAKGRA